MRQIDTYTDIFESQKRVISNTQASKPGDQGLRRSLLFCLFEPKIEQIVCSLQRSLLSVIHRPCFYKAVIGQSPSRVVVRYPNNDNDP